jgi:hypothetical protein
VLQDTIPEEAFTAPTLKIRSICQGKCGKYYDKKATALGTFVLCDWMWGWLLRGCTCTVAMFMLWIRNMDGHCP